MKVYDGGISKMRINNSVFPNFCYESRSYLVTKATQNLGHIGRTQNE